MGDGESRRRGEWETGRVGEWETGRVRRQPWSGTCESSDASPCRSFRCGVFSQRLEVFHLRYGAGDASAVAELAKVLPLRRFAVPLVSLRRLLGALGSVPLPLRRGRCQRCSGTCQSSDVSRLRSFRFGDFSHRLEVWSGTLLLLRQLGLNHFHRFHRQAAEDLGSVVPISKGDGAEEGEPHQRGERKLPRVSGGRWLLARHDLRRARCNRRAAGSGASEFSRALSSPRT